MIWYKPIELRHYPHISVLFLNNGEGIVNDIDDGSKTGFPHLVTLTQAVNIDGLVEE